MPDQAAETGYDLVYDERVILQSVAAQYGVLPAAQREMPWPEWLTLVAGLMDGTPLGHLVAVRTEHDPAVLRRLTPWQQRARAQWRHFLAGRAAGGTPQIRRRQRGLQAALEKLFAPAARPRGGDNGNGNGTTARQPHGG